MNVRVLYRPNSEQGTPIEEYCREFVKENPSRKVQLIDVDSSSGTELAGVYGVVSYPAFLVTSSDGSVVKLWQGENETPPLMNELGYYIASI